MSMAGRLSGIARHDRPRGPMQTVQHVQVTRQSGIAGDCRGTAREGKAPRRQVSLIEAESWAAALADLRADAEADFGGDIAWSERRANLLVEGIRLPRRAGAIIAIGPSLRIETTMECDPCSRMEDLQSGLRAALTPDWRGGVLGRVIADGEIAVGDSVTIVEE